jgi:hypothetical protein
MGQTRKQRSVWRRFKPHKNCYSASPRLFKPGFKCGLKQGVWLVGVALLLTAAPVSRVWASDLPVKADPLAPKPMAIGAWLFAPTLFAGTLYNSNVNQTADKVSSWGERVVPGFTASLDNGIHQTSIYGLADFQNYSNSAVIDKTVVDAKAGVSQVYLPTPELTIKLNGDYTRQADVFGAAAFAPANTPLGATSGATIAPTTVSPQVSASRSNQYSGSFSADQRFGRAFAGLGFSAVSTQFDSEPAGTANRDGTVYTVSGRGGFDLTPQIYTFVDPAVNWQRYTDSNRDANGYRVTAGFGTSAPGLWQGEIYGGYQSEKNDIVGSYGGGVVGLRLGYSPNRFWDLRGSVDETLGASSIATNGTAGVATRVTTGLLNVAYHGMPRGWTVSGRFGYVRTAFVNIDRDDNGWLTGANVGYEIWRNFGVAVDYQFKSVDSSAAGQSFDQHQISLGATYKY